MGKIEKGWRLNVPQANFDRQVYSLLGLPFDAVDIYSATKTVRVAISNRQSCFFSTPNLNFLIACLHDVNFRNSVIHSDMSVADGMPLIWIARMLRVPLPERVAGSSMFENLQNDNANEMKVYFFGGKVGVAEAACRQLNTDGGLVHCVGYESPGFGSVEQMSTDETIARINASGADFLVVALGAQKGNAWIEHNLARLNVPVISHLGAVLNFVAGTLKRAPKWMQHFGLEWLWRIKEEPALWKRYLFDGKAFVLLLFFRVLPYAWYLLRHRPISREIERSAILIKKQVYGVELVMHGAWSSSNLDPMRETFKQCSKESVEIRLDMSDVTYVDSAVIGLLMVLLGHQQLVGSRLILLNVSQPVRQVFKWNCAEYLLSSDGGLF
jgi:N-acetylglucosaminyldiphosphoundecaprenol N-acetyl-beta-D-mannosaminyltransferase